jgi:predicted DCC family thiol-disulfide oxidoreductase YuxK
MADPSGRTPQACLLVYDGQCRLCVTAKQGLEGLGTQVDAIPIRMVPYQSEEAKQALGEAYRPGRPDVAFLVRPNGEIATGLDAFLALLPGLRGGRVLSILLRLPLVKPVGYLLYWLVARYRYQVFGTVPFAGASENPSSPSREAPHK